MRRHALAPLTNRSALQGAWPRAKLLMGHGALLPHSHTLPDWGLRPSTLKPVGREEGWSTETGGDPLLQ